MVVLLMLVLLVFVYVVCGFEFVVMCDDVVDYEYYELMVVDVATVCDVNVLYT